MTPPIRGVPLSTPKSRLLRLKVVQAKDVSKELFGSSDQFVQIILCKKNNDTSVVEILKTHTVKKSSNPVFNTDFVLNVVPTEHKLIIELVNENRITRNDSLGRVTIPLDNSRIIISNESELNATNKVDFPLEKKSLFSKAKGKLNLIIHYISSADLIDNILGVDATHSSPNAPDSLAQQPQIHQPVRTNSVSSQMSNEQNSETNNDPLPQGWEQRSDQNGRIYYVDHISKTTTWIRPTTRSAHVSPNVNNSSGTSGSEANAGALNASQNQTRRPSSANQSSGQNAQMVRRHFNEDNASSETSLENDANSQNSQENDANPPQSSSQSATQQASSTTSPTSGVVVQENGVRTSPDEPPLPPGWDFSRSDKGRIFFIDHVNKQTTWIDPRTGKPSPQPDYKGNIIGPLPAGWEERRHVDGRIFYIDHNRKTTQWEDPRLEKFPGPAVPYSRDYKQKFETFKKLIPPPPPKNSQFGGAEKYFIRVRRNNVLEDSFHKIMNEKNPEYFRMPLWIEFDGEKSYDYGGVAREWFHVLSKEIFNPYYGLFEYSAIDNYTLQINPNSGLVNENHLEYFHFIGRVIGMAAYHSRLIDGFFIRPFYKMMLNKSIILKDIEAVDMEYYKSMQYIIDTDEVEALDLMFTTETDIFGQKVEHELKENGKNIKVTNENKKEFIDLVIHWRFVKRIEEQMKSFMKGFNEIVPSRCILLFDPKELELLLSGLGDINIKDWQLNTVYKGEYHPNHRVIQWFWMAMYSFPNELRLRFLQFVTGTSRVPMNGFAELQGSNGYQKFTIQSWGDHRQLPRAHTCFNRLDLPQYYTYDMLREKLILAIENSEGFDGVD